MIAAMLNVKVLNFTLISLLKSVFVWDSSIIYLYYISYFKIFMLFFFLSFITPNPLHQFHLGMKTLTEMKQKQP